MNNKYRIWGRIRDIFCSVLALVILSPVMLATAIVIYIDDPHGSPIFKQVRCGRDGAPFTMYKFRSMYRDAEIQLPELYSSNEADGPVFKIKNDPRITKVGRFIRRTGIDELPQLINILLGQMSFVGPRPALPSEVEKYTDFQRQRLSVTPGLTCLWQICPSRNALSFDEWMELDMRYIRERSFLLDWKIILLTVPVVFRGDGE